MKTQTNRTLDAWFFLWFEQVTGNCYLLNALFARIVIRKSNNFGIVFFNANLKTALSLFIYVNRYVTLYFTRVVWPSIVRTQVIAILCGSQSNAQQSEHSSWEKMHMVSMEIGSVGSCMCCQVFNMICFIQNQTIFSVSIANILGIFRF